MLLPMNELLSNPKCVVGVHATASTTRQKDSASLTRGYGTSTIDDERKEALRQEHIHEQNSTNVIRHPPSFTGSMNHDDRAKTYSSAASCQNGSSEPVPEQNESLVALGTTGAILDILQHPPRQLELSDLALKHIETLHQQPLPTSTTGTEDRNRGQPSSNDDKKRSEEETENDEGGHKAEKKSTKPKKIKANLRKGKWTVSFITNHLFVSTSRLY